MAALRLVTLAIFVALMGSTPTMAQDEAPELEAFCAVPCVQRAISGSCFRWGADFCTPFEGTACVLNCVDRSINGRCLNFGTDFCGVYPECVPNCIRRSVNGMCMNYDSDQCMSL